MSCMSTSIIGINVYSVIGYEYGQLTKGNSLEAWYSGQSSLDFVKNLYQAVGARKVLNLKIEAASVRNS